jgi:hypothetical protein
MAVKSNAEELALVAQETGAEVVSGAARCREIQPADTRYLVLKELNHHTLACDKKEAICGNGLGSLGFGHWLA